MKTQKIIDRCAQKFRHTKTLSLRIVITIKQRIIQIVTQRKYFESCYNNIIT